jgi:hypothetical protein
VSSIPALASPPPSSLPATSASSPRQRVVASGNSAPKITSTALTKAKEDEFYVYTPTVTDQDSGDVHTWTLVQSAPEMSFDPSSGRIFWRPGDRYAGLSYALELKVCDKAGDCDTQKWKLQVEDVNDAPRIVSLPSTIATERKLYEYKPQWIDPDRNENHKWTLKVAPQGMTVDAKTGELLWTPGNHQSEQELSVQLELCDKAKSCDVQTWKIFIRNINDPPKITSLLPPQKAQEDVVYKVTPVVQDPDPNETLTWQLLKGSSRARMDTQTGVLIWVPDDADARIPQTFEWQVCDKSGACDKQTWTVLVQQINDPPKLLSTPGLSAKQGSRYEYTPVYEDPDIHDVHTWTLVKGPSSAQFSTTTGEIRWTPSAAEVNQNFVLELKLCDKAGTCDTQTWTIKVSNVNDSPRLTSTAPTTAKEEVKYLYQIKFTDPDPGDTHNWVLKQAPKGVTLNPTTLTLEWSPTQAQTDKEFTFELQVCDKAKACDSKVWKVKVANVNDAPRFTTLAPTAATEDKPYRYTPRFQDEDTNDAHTWTLTQGPSGSNVLFDKRSGVLEWLPGDKDASTSVDFELKVCDKAGTCDTQNWTVNVKNVNDQPVITTKPSVVVKEEKLYTYTAKATDPDPNESLSWSMAFIPDGFQFDAKKAELRWTPKRTDSGKVYELEIRVCDKSNTCAIQSWKLTVNNVNNAPRLKGSLPSTGYVNERMLIQFFAEDDDPADSHTWKLLKGPSGISFPADTGRFTWTPAQSDMDRTLTFEVQVCDNGTPVACDSKSFQVTVTQRCKLDVDCANGYVCEARLCRKTQCNQQQPCKDKKEICVRGRCQSNPCLSTQCKPGLVCQPTTGLCISACNPADCKAGERCTNGRCTPGPCAAHPCRSDQVCDDWTEPSNPTCIKNPCISGSCAAGRFCNVQGQCTDDLCASIRCPASSPRCVNNQCLPALACKADRDCPADDICTNQQCNPVTCTKTSDCKANERCLSGKCQTNPCLDSKGKPKCNKLGEFCRSTDGLCVKACAGVACASNQKCVDGKCVADPCQSRICPVGTVCQKGSCVKDACRGKTLCKHGRVCSLAQNSCADDPCAGVTCPSSKQVCRDGQCLPPETCDLDIECSNNLLCIGRRCRLPECVTNGDCKKGLLCLGGRCQEDLCTSKTCPKGQFCYAGQCQLSCAGIFCAKDEMCVDGKCLINPCDGVECDGLKICVNGRCKPELCGFQSCKAGRTCVLDRCVVAACDRIQCPKGQTGKNGECTGEVTCVQDADCPSTSICLQGKCQKSTCFKEGCPDGQICKEGACVVNPCRRRKCRQGEFCSPADGRCLLIAERCNKGEHFVDGRCEKDPCASVTCNAGQRCDKGTCVNDLCTVSDNKQRCKFSRVCFKNSCKLDPCAQVDCGGSALCRDGYCYFQPQEEAPPPDGGILPPDLDKDTGQKQDKTPPPEPRKDEAGGFRCSLNSDFAGFLSVFGMLFLLLPLCFRKKRRL